MMKAVRQWNTLSRGVVGILSLQVGQCFDLPDVVEDVSAQVIFKSPFQSKPMLQFYDSLYGDISTQSEYVWLHIDEERVILLFKTA